MTTIYVVTRVLTFFGTYLRTFWEHVVCRICKIPAEDVRAFKYDELCGHVEHEIIRKTSHAFLMCWLPFTLNFIVGTLFLLTGSFRVFYIGEVSLTSFGVLWLGISCLANCAPSFEDMLAFKDCVYGGSNKALKVILAPLFGVVCAMACLEKYSLTFVLSMVYAAAFPHIFSVVFPALHKLIVLIQG